MGAGVGKVASGGVGFDLTRGEPLDVRHVLDGSSSCTKMAVV